MTNPARAPERARECRHGNNTFTPPCPACQRLEELAAERAREWHPIATAPRNEEVFFRVVPKEPDETWVDSSGKPIVSTHQPYLHRGKFGTWGALSKATHWMPLPDLGAAVAPVEGPS